MTEDPLSRAFEAQGRGCGEFGSAYYAELAQRIAAELDPVRRLFAPWEGASFEDLIGAFVNMLPLRTPVHPQDSFRAVLARVRETTLAAYAHQELPFERVIISHGEPVHTREAFERALELPEWPAGPLHLAAYRGDLDRVRRWFDESMTQFCQRATRRAFQKPKSSLTRDMVSHEQYRSSALRTT